MLKFTRPAKSEFLSAYRSDLVMMTAAVLAKRANVPLFTVRYYTRIGLLKPTRDLRNGYKVYKPTDKDRLHFISSAKNLGFTLAEIEEILGHAVHGDSPCPMVRDIVERRIKENRVKIIELNRLQARLEAAMDMWKTMKNSEPDGHSVCHLIELFSASEMDA
jgi:MerR family Zn(II)-responsive transcriptional regulator of zntA